MEFVLGACASVGAGVFSNPLDVLKTKAQLQGELRARGQYSVHYKNMFHAAYMITKEEGLFALQVCRHITSKRAERFLVIFHIFILQIKWQWSERRKFSFCLLLEILEIAGYAMPIISQYLSDLELNVNNYIIIHSIVSERIDPSSTSSSCSQWN